MTIFVSEEIRRLEIYRDGIMISETWRCEGKIVHKGQRCKHGDIAKIIYKDGRTEEVTQK